MHTLLVTLIGPQRSVDLRLPSEVPISEFMPTLLKICGPQLLDTQQANLTLWGLVCQECNVPLDLKQSLLEAGIGNGARLILCDTSSQVQHHKEPVTAPRLTLPSRRTASSPIPVPMRGHPPHKGPSDPMITFHVPVRDYPPHLPNEEIVINAPPQISATTGGAVTWLQALLPIVGALGGSLFFLLYFVNGTSRQPLMLVIAIAVPLLTIVTSLATHFIQRWTAKKQRAYTRETYLEYLTAWRIRLREIAELQQQVSTRLYPTPTTIAKLVIDRLYLWERRTEDPDFLHVSIGRGAVPLCSHIRLNLSSDPMIKYEPELRTKAELLVAQYHHLENEPAVISLRTIGLLAITGKRVATRPLVRAILCQLVAFHTPRDVRCIACFPSDAVAEWEWLKWLPHAQRLRYTKATKQQVGEPLCLLADNALDCHELFITQIKPELELRRKLSEDKSENTVKHMLPHLIFIIDGFTVGGELAQLPELDELFRDAAKLGVTILCIVDELNREPTGTQARIVISDEGWLSFEITKFDGWHMTGITPDAATTEICEQIAHSLASLTLAGDGAEDDLSQDVRLLDLLDIPTPEAIEPSKMRTACKREALLRVPIGKREKGKTLLLDLKEAAEKGDGPHGLVVGATGSGKSELLRTLVISQAILHDPCTVNFVFVDFKGGASFADLAALPHVAGMITNLENEPTLIDRMHASLLGELRRRQRMLREAGNLDKIQDYREKWQKNQETIEPLPHLLIIVDEFAELLTNRPDFLDLFITIGRVGRSLGLHLLLATQRLEEGRLKGLESYLRYRICLRTFSAAESAAVLGKPDAYYLPSAPGIGYLKIDANTPQRFKTALISMPYVPATQQISAADFIREFTGTGRLMMLFQTTVPVSTSISTTNIGQTEMDVTIARLADPTQAPVHQVWLPPLAKNLRLAHLIGRNFDSSSWYRPAPFGTLRIPVGLLDVPLDQAQVPLMLDFSGAGGHLAIVGAPQSGKSTFLRTLMTSFIVTHSPRDVQLYSIDLGGGQLRPFEALPHVGAICTQTDHEKIRLLIRLMSKIITDRQMLFRDHNIESMATYRSYRQNGQLSDFPFGDVFLIIDNMAQLQHDFEQIEAEIINLATTGLTYGIHIILATNRWPEIRPKLRDNIGTRLELRLNDPVESEIDRKKAAELPIGIPGRGLTKDKLQFQVYLPSIDTDSTEHAHKDNSLTTLIERVQGWKGPVASPILMLPTKIKRQEIVHSEKQELRGVPIGLEEFRLDPVYLDLLSMGPHFLILGDSECGKTNLLRLWSDELMQRYTPEQVQLAVIECRSTTNLLDIMQSEHCLTYASMRIPSSLKESVECLTTKLKERALPATAGSIKELRSAKTWTGPHYFLFVDDYDAIAAPSGNALTPLRDFIIQGRDIGFHLILARTISGLASTSFEPLIKSLREMGSPGLIMSGDRQEGKLLHDQIATNQPVGRGYLVRRKYPPTLVQVALA